MAPTMCNGRAVGKSATAGCIVAVLVLASCGSEIGQPCDVGTDAGPSQAVANTLALECESHLCLKPKLSPDKPSLNPPTGALCSVECKERIDCIAAESRDSTNPSDTRCKAGFVCAVPFEVGPLCCRRLCVCKDFLGPNGPVTPLACAGPDSASTCR